jgi:beta-N-acetylhexosaminidase
MLLHCNGRLEEMREVAAVAPDLTKLAAARAERALALRRKVDAGDVAALRAEVQHLLFREA